MKLLLTDAQDKFFERFCISSLITLFIFDLFIVPINPLFLFSPIALLTIHRLIEMTRVMWWYSRLSTEEKIKMETENGSH